MKTTYEKYPQNVLKARRFLISPVKDTKTSQRTPENFNYFDPALRLFAIMEVVPVSMI
jgi:hypothetical protein